jgi:Tol biopolymer transport system component
LKEVTVDEKGRMQSPVWTPDGRSVVYANLGVGVFMREVGASSPPRQLPVKLAPDEIPLPRSWSPDGRTLGLSLLSVASEFKGVLLFTPDTGKTTRVSDLGAGPLWFADGAHLVFSDQGTGRVFVADVKTGARQVVFTLPLSRIDGTAISGDRQTFYGVFSALESDVWVLNLK